MDRGLNELLKWSIENASAATNDNDPAAAPPVNRGLNPEALAALFGGPSDAQLMQEAMAVITAPARGTPDATGGAGAGVSLDNRLVAFDNLEQLIESLDNANLMDTLGLWAPLLGVLASDEPELRRMAAWCVGTAVQNNARSQAQLLAAGGLPPLVRLAASAGESAAVRRKAIYALSSACRNCQPAMDACLAALAALETRAPALAALPAAIDAANMDAVDAIMNGLKQDVAAAEQAAAAKAAAAEAAEAA